MSLKNKLNRMKPHLSGKNLEKEELKRPDTKIEAQRQIPYLDLWQDNNVTVYWSDQEYCLIREVRFPLSFWQGKYQLGDCINAVEAWNKSSYSHPLSSKGHSVEDLFFFDTETTGLRGVGSTIFMLGYARFTAEEVIVRQHILTQPGFEVPLYMSFLENVDYSTLVTYNGKSFDWPQVKSRHTLIREHVPKLPETGHFDLYHASRRLWKHKMKSVKLTEVERHILEFERSDDLPGYLAPAIFFDFIERNHPEGMLKVLDHNEKDILSLISLYTHLTFQLLGQDKLQTSSESLEAGKWYRYTGDFEASSTHINEAYTKDPLNSKAVHALAFELKRNGSLTRAVELWLKVTENGEPREKREAALELAKVYEHKLKDYAQAVYYANMALKCAEDDYAFRKSSKEILRKQTEHRIQRLSRKYKAEY
ncbi:ribonuclease H-like domain-containing protein [Jeotgalibacillus proteolyticus]|uniref:YprB ribonuclease H-like domain-containing protein n=1 Tax=Jeotgalibacillus proteolyticus TaxID=2082395 RepID=A0A2S5GE84_9BACL|nr:ribonuclease H-like domain-containing protein [Jeotgalibacillus proteolyticus]PPA71225.1 hypothetical protein C4B60_03950 [Jeotgalibacillus proteolyticus]